MPEVERKTVPGPGGSGIKLTASEWLVVGLLGAFGVALFALMLLPYGPLAHSLDGVPYRSYVGVLAALVAGGIAGLGLGQWWDYRPGGPGWRNRPPEADPRRQGIQGAPTFEIYTPDSVEARRGK